MPILNLQMSQMESGRIRLGMKVKSGGRERPTKLDRFRFTSPRKNLIEKIAELYGGTVQPWQPPKGSAQWEVVTNATEVPVVVPPQDPAQSQWYELWSAGGCQRRCDGQTEMIGKQPCVCDPEARDCKMHTRLRVMLEDVPGMGVWRVDTGSYYAATELPGIAQLLAQAQGAIPGRLVLDQRTVTRSGKTMNFAVPVLDCADITPKELMSGRVQELMAARAAGAIAGQLRDAAAITAGPSKDYRSLIDAAKNREALVELHTQAKVDFGGDVPAELLDLFTARAKVVEAPQATVATTVVTPTTSDDPLGEVWAEILAESPWDGAEELERHFCQLVGHSSDEASLEDMRKFLDAIRQAKTKQAAA
jgi:recombination directionality factor gp3-like protein